MDCRKGLCNCFRLKEGALAPGSKHKAGSEEMKSVLNFSDNAEHNVNPSLPLMSPLKL